MVYRRFKENQASYCLPIDLECLQLLRKILLIILITLPANARAEDKILESVNITGKQDFSLVDIQLNQQLTVTSYSPLSKGDLLRIKVKRTGTALQLTELPANHQTLPWRPTNNVPLYQVTADLADQSVILRFKHPVKYNVRGGTNSFHIFIEVFHAKAKERHQTLELPVSNSPAIKIKKYAIEEAQDPRLAQVMHEARTAMLKKDYSRAVQLYTKVELEGPASIYAKDALEYLGLAREYKGQIAHAKAAYKKYLQLYPEGEDAERVQQRLTGILTARNEPRGKLRKGKSTANSAPDLQWDTFGSVSQFYNRNEIKRNDNDARLTRSSLQNNLDLSSRLRIQDYQIAGRFSGSYNANFETALNDEQRISTFYLDFNHLTSNTALRVGRQSRSTGGILGRFDGLVTSIPVMTSVQLNLVAGYSVESSRDIFINNDVYFYGINADLGTFFNAWDFNAFFIEQINHGILDRRAVGGEIRYFHPNRSFFTFLDYDIHHNALNTFLFTGQYVFPDRTTVNISYDHRKSPLLTTRNALQGQGSIRGAESVDDLLKFFSEDEIWQLAKDRTATSKSLSVGLSRPLSDRFQINADFRMTNFSATQTSGGVMGMASSGDEFFYSTDLTGNSLLTNGDIYVVGFRYNDLDRANILTFTFNGRYPITRELIVNPRFRFDLRNNVDGTTRWVYRPSVRAIYRVFRSLQFEVEIGGDWEKQERTMQERAFSDSGEFDRIKGYYLIGGYRLDF